MDPITAVGLASGILTFIDAGTKLIKTAYAIHNSLDGVLDDNRHREDIAGTVQDAASRLEITGILALTKEQQSLTELAKRCKAISEHLIQLSDKIKPKGSSFKAFNSLRHAVKANKNKKLIGDLESHLKDYRDQLSLVLIDISRVEAADGFSRLVFLAKNNKAKLKILIQAMEHLRQGQLSAQTGSSQELQQLLVVDTTTRHSMGHDFLLNCLKFQGINHRYEAVHTAHEDTFSWIYEPIEPVEYEAGKPYHKEVDFQKMQIESRGMFLSWLSSEVPMSPIFHISGKLGSGKSTLMKFLCSHPRTKEELTKWAGVKKLAFTSFFFWRNGSTLEKSLDGLCRSILHCFLAARRDLLAEAFPRQWKDAEQGPWKTQAREEIPSWEAKHALEKLLRESRLYQRHRFCIFIDGLDEFEPGLQDGLDYIDLVDILRRWSSHADGNLKLCLSSREEPVFLEGFADAPSFRLQNLTRFDMQNYVRSRLSNLSDDDLKDELTVEIQERSSGIFLWIYLVVKSIRNKMTHRATSETLREYLDTLPQGLESLFHHVLQQLEPDDKRKTLQLISCLQVAKPYELDLPLIAFSLLDNYSRDSNFSLRDGLEDEMLPDESALQAQLRGASGGLIECSGEKGERKVMEFVHRSVPDMFHKDARNPDLTREMDMALRGINCIDLMSHLCFAAARLAISDTKLKIDKEHFRSISRHVCYTIARVQLIHGNDNVSYQFLNSIEPWMEELEVKEDSKFYLDIDLPGAFWVATPEGQGDNLKKSSTMAYNLNCLAAYANRGYLDWKIGNDPSTLDNSVKRAMVGHSLLMSENWDMFFQYSIVARGAPMALLISFPGAGFPFDEVSSDCEHCLTAWQFFLFNVITVGHDDPNAPGDIISEFLRVGADPYCRIVITQTRKGGGEVAVTFCFRQLSSPQYLFYPDVTEGFSDKINQCQLSRGKPEIKWDTEFQESFSLREWVAVNDWDNVESLLELLDCDYEEDRET